MSHTTRRKVASSLGALAAVLAIGFGASACVDSEEPVKVGSAGSEQGGGGADDGGQKGKDSPKSETFAVGDRIKLGDWEFTVHEVTDPLKPTNEFLTPKSGNRWVAIDLEAKNNGSKNEVFSTLLALELKDSQNKVYDVTITGEDAQKQPDGDVAAGESRRGTVVYEVPEDAKGLKLVFKPSLFGGSKATVDLGA